MDRLIDRDYARMMTEVRTAGQDFRLGEIRPRKRGFFARLAHRG